MSFLDLPIEILPLILSSLVKPQHLVHVCLVSQTFSAHATPQLYNRISIYSWHKQGKVKVLKLFRTLSECSHLAHHVRRLEIRDFPRTAAAFEDHVMNQVMKGLQNCVNLRTCTWTRDGTLSTETLAILASLPNLQEMELNGHSQGHYNPTLLSRFRGLTKLSLIMPSSEVIEQLVRMLKISGASLRQLTIICKASPVLKDATLGSMAPSLVNLEQLFLTGCTRVTNMGVVAVLDANQVGLIGLGLEGLSPRFNMRAFADHCNLKQSLPKLRSITLTVSQAISEPEAWARAALDLLSASPLEKFQMYAIAATSEVYRRGESVSLQAIIPQFLKDLLSQHGERLRRFSVHRIPLVIPSILDICLRCPTLQELFIAMEPRWMGALPDALVHAKNLRTFHVNYSLENQLQDASDRDTESDEEQDSSRTVLSPDQTSAFVQRCGSSLVQFGCNTSVWQVGRKIITQNDGSKEAEVCLLPYESLDIPEQFLVIRT
ncbi:hypothetical protein BKA70DRAFT_1097619 [Coprinopsis sp. MPI-PUGE-AT-0042]|nr:hypothetical protein BKA70DRAFT_1097619 [Coprinopsis sp. MPI-PUGE-AT-0042]